MAGHEDIWVTSVAFDQHGLRIVSGGVDGTVRLWDARMLQPIGAPVRGHRDAVLGVAFGRDGTRVVSGSEDGTLRFWPARSAWAAELCARVGRNMSRQEWREAVPANIPYLCQCPGLPIPADNRGTAVPAELCPPAR